MTQSSRKTIRSARVAAPARVPLHAVKPGLTQTVLGLDWEKYLPLSLKESGTAVSTATFAEVAEFAGKNFSAIYAGQNQKFSAVENNGNRAAFYDSAVDCFLFSDPAVPKPIGIMVGNLLDWGTYYIRNISLLPGYQGRRIYQGFLAQLLSILKAYGVARVEIHISPSNLANLHIHQKFQFLQTGMQVSERWGTLLQLTKHLDPTKRNDFETNFCAVSTKAPLSNP